MITNVCVFWSPLHSHNTEKKNALKYIGRSKIDNIQKCLFHVVLKPFACDLSGAKTNDQNNCLPTFEGI